MWWKFRKEGSKEPTKNNISDVARKVKHVELTTKKHSSTQLLGQYRSRFRGQGMQFSDFRVYQFGDDVRHIDWRLSARSQQTYTKVYEEERELNIICAVDISASGVFGTHGETKRDLLSLAIATIAFAAISNSDRVGLLLFSDQVERYVPPRKGKKHVLRIIDELLSHKAKHRGTSLTKAMQFLAGVARHNSIVILASDFYAPLERKKLNLLAQRNDLIAMHIHDDRDLELPAIGLAELIDPETGESLLIDCSSKIVQKNFSLEQKKRLQHTTQALQRAGASVISLNTKNDVSREVGAFFRRRTRAK